MGSNKNWCLDDVNKAVELHHKGHTLTEIAIKLGRPKGGVTKVLSRNGVKRPKGRIPVEGSAWSDGTPIGPTSYDRNFPYDCMVASQKLLAAIERAGVRP
jgi:hypothetical protein